MNLDFASVWEMIADIIPENDALISSNEVISWIMICIPVKLQPHF